MNIVVDGMGGDFAPKNVIDGIKSALSERTDIQKLLITGDEDIIKKQVDASGLKDKRVEIVHASQVVEMHDPATAPLRQKKDSSISIAADLVKNGDAQAFFSAGHTGASVAATSVKWRMLKGVDRPGIASPVPAEHGIGLILDAGANVDAKPKHLVQYAVMGSVYLKHVIGVDRPKIGLMSVGEEDHKGTDFTREVFAMLKEAPVNFVGNIEGNDVFDKGIDVILCDGFTGNVLLKACEGTAKIMFKWIKSEIKASPMRMLGALISQNAFKAVKKRGSYESYGGSPLLGVNGICIIGHGSSSSIAVKNGIRVACEAVTHRVNPHIEEELAKLTPTEDPK